MREHCPVCDLKAARGFSSAAAILFIPVAVLPGLNVPRNIRRFFAPKPSKKAPAVWEQTLLTKIQAWETLHNFQAVLNDRKFPSLSAFSQLRFERYKGIFLTNVFFG